MIKLSDSAITIINPDGTRFTFEIDELQSKIIQSCLAAGIKDVWIAEDISLSIEYALGHSENRQRVFTLEDLHYLVVKILEETGFPEVAESFKLQHDIEDETVSINGETVRQIIENNLGLLGKSQEQLAEKTQAALSLLKINDAPSNLVLELAKYYKSTEAPIDDISSLVATKKDENSWRVDESTVYEMLSDTAKSFIDDSIIQLNRVTPLYPSIKVDLRITKFANFLNLEAPLTEMVIIPYFTSISDAINEIVKVYDHLYDEVTEGTEAERSDALPVYLIVRDMSLFAKEWLLSVWPDAYDCCEDMLYYLIRDLKRGLFKLQLS